MKSAQVFRGEIILQKFFTKSAIVACAVLVLGLCCGTPAVQAAVAKAFNKQIIVSGTNFVPCPAGYKVTGGGAGVLPQASNSTKTAYILRASYPYNNGWKAVASKVLLSQSGLSFNITDTTQSVGVWAICVR
jgi:hypothetical protein